jgi:meiotically up-regulated gene 157 (Mug157) protein
MGEAPSYDSNGKMITGLLQGSYLSTADAMKSSYMKTFMNMITVGTNEIRAQFNKYSNYIITDTKNYYEEVNRSSLEQYTLGHADKYHIVFFETDGNGQISKEFKLKNP